jgi:hypothetical protein
MDAVPRIGDAVDIQTAAPSGSVTEYRVVDVCWDVSIYESTTKASVYVHIEKVGD